jgi:hypothetical protein
MVIETMNARNNHTVIIIVNKDMETPVLENIFFSIPGFRKTVILEGER